MHGEVKVGKGEGAGAAGGGQHGQPPLETEPLSRGRPLDLPRQSPELRLLVMSATLNLQPLVEQLPEAVLLSSEGRSHPVAISHQAPRERESLPSQVIRALEGHWISPDTLRYELDKAETAMRGKIGK